VTAQRTALLGRDALLARVTMDLLEPVAGDVKASGNSLTIASVTEIRGKSSVLTSWRWYADYWYGSD
jgi:hypothetical protein